MEIVGRKAETQRLTQTLQSQNSELVVVYGRRRIGKTFLIREFFKENIVFEVSGLYDGNMSDQLAVFYKQLNQGKKVKQTWMEAFSDLEKHINRLRSKKKKVIFIDEFPWLATKRSKFLMAFDHFWNTYCTKRNDLVVVICGSAASYMIKNIINSKGGLHNRITQKIKLLPFNLSETQEYLLHKKIQYTHYDILQLYMSLGGVPYYLNQLERGKSATQNIDKLCFDKNAPLKDEFDLLFASLFQNSEIHLKMVEALHKKNSGLTRDELIGLTKLKSGGDFTSKLQELIESGFVSEHPFYQNKNKSTKYRLSDEYTKFYLKFIVSNKRSGAGTWQRLSKNQSFISWAGFAFESICLKHIEQIKKALGIQAIYSTASSWYNEHAQIDLLIDRDDHVINLCEMKFYNSTFTIDKKYYTELKNKIAAFQQETQTSKNLFLTMLTSYGVSSNEYAKELVQNELRLEDLFND